MIYSLDLPAYVSTVDCSVFVLNNIFQNNGNGCLGELVHKRLEQLPSQNRDPLTDQDTNKLIQQYYWR